MKQLKFLYLLSFDPLIWFDSFVKVLIHPWPFLFPRYENNELILKVELMVLKSEIINETENENKCSNNRRHGNGGRGRCP
jgi:hypothetical protein